MLCCRLRNYLNHGVLSPIKDYQSALSLGDLEVYFQHDVRHFERFHEVASIAITLDYEYKSDGLIESIGQGSSALLSAGVINQTVLELYATFQQELILELVESGVPIYSPDSSEVKENSCVVALVEASEGSTVLELALYCWSGVVSVASDMNELWGV